MPQEDLSWLPVQPKAAKPVDELDRIGLYRQAATAPEPPSAPSSKEDLSWLPVQPQAPKAIDTRSYPRQVADRFTSSLKTQATNPSVYAALAGAAAIPFTGGLSLPAAMALEGAAAGGGTVVGHGIKAAAGDASSAEAIALDTGVNAAIGATGPVLGRAIGAVPGSVKAVTGAAWPVVRTAGGAAFDVATGHPLRAAGKVLGYILDAAKPAAKAAPPPVVPPRPVYTGTSMAPTKMPNVSFSMPAPRPPVQVPVVAPPAGRVVPPETPSINTALADALEALRAPKTPPVELPPQVTLPAGYTPRATVPKPKPAKMAAPPPAQEPAAPPKRAYFLKSEEELATARAPSAPSPKPTGEIRIQDLPESWQSRVGQDLFPLTGAEGDAVAAELAAELSARGLSRSEALMAVSKNKDISTQARQQLMKALGRVKVKGGA